MKVKIFLFLGIIFSIIFTGCPSPDPEPTPTPTPISIGGRPIGDVYMSIIENTIYNVSVGMEYSLDNRGSWTTCTGSVVSVSFSVGDRVWVREIGDSSTEVFLGEVNALSGYSDLIASDAIYIMRYNDPYYDDYATGVPDDNMEIWFDFYNIGDTSGYSADHQIRFYLSDDKEITSADTLLYDYNYDYSCPLGEVYGDTLVFTVPPVASGTYYIGCIIDETDQIQELNEGNNATLPKDVAEILIAETTVSPAPDGAFKVINSWGTSGAWEKVHDGHYWVTYDTMKYQQINIWYYYNTFTHVYKPTVIVVFGLTHPRREECKIIFGLGNPSDPYIQKEFQMRWNSDIKGGPEPFPANNMALDISEFAQFINDFDLFLSVENLGVDDGSLDYFTVEFYENYDDPPFDTIAGGTGSIPASSTTNFVVSTEGALSGSQVLNIMPLSRSDINGNIFIEEKPDEEELKQDMRRSGVFKEGKNYNYINSECFGTGLIPPTEEQWRSFYKLKGLQTSGSRAAMPEALDHSVTNYFPPVGDQGTEGSCVCFSFGYYIGTFMEAVEHGWNLSGATWTGEPDIAHQNMIFSPDFIYHQINNGVDDGSSYAIAATFMINIGCCSWQEMPYNVADSTTWPSETAYREAARYRGTKTGNHYYDYLQNGYFIIQTDDDINLLKQLLNAGYCVSMAIDGSENGWWFYDLLSLQDVIDDTEAALMDTDHAQTIVGYKEGTLWNDLDPEN